MSNSSFFLKYTRSVFIGVVFCNCSITSTVLSVSKLLSNTAFVALWKHNSLHHPTPRTLCSFRGFKRIIGDLFTGWPFQYFKCSCFVRPWHLRHQQPQGMDKSSICCTNRFTFVLACFSRRLPGYLPKRESRMLTGILAFLFRAPLSGTVYVTIWIPGLGDFKPKHLFRFLWLWFLLRNTE